MRKKNSPSELSFTAPEKGKSGKFFTYFITILLLGIIAYYIYSKSSPAETIVVEADNQEQVESETTEQVESKPPLEQKVQVEILNGCGVNNIAKIFESVLRTEGFDVVNTDNLVENGKVNWKVKDSKIIDLRGKKEDAEKAAKILGISKSHVVSQANPKEIYDLRIIIGQDFKNLDGYKSYPHE